MRVRVSYIVEASDYLRRAINAYYGLPGLASRDDVKNWYEQNGRSMDDDVSVEYDLKVERGLSS